MPARRFIGYFLVLATCATIAFASSLIGHPPMPVTQETDSSLMPLLSAMPHGRLHKTTLHHAQIAQVE